MASKNNFTYYFSPPTSINHNHSFEFDESNIIWNNNNNNTLSSPSSGPITEVQARWAPRRSMKKPGHGPHEITEVSMSAPVSIPVWGRRERNEDEEEDEDGGWIPPHEQVARRMARRRVVAYSVEEGVGRTLKGRDLNRVRNAIWEQTGFQD